jgi:hypothetical protein
MSSKMSMLEHMQLAMEENAYAEFLHMAAEEEDGVYNEEEHTTRRTCMRHVLSSNMLFSHIMFFL